MSNKKHPAAIARDEWFESNEGKGCVNAETLETRNKHYYLRNRLMRAFEAGWKACEASAATD